jgi:hypothetical protein
VDRDKVRCLWCNARFMLDEDLRVGDHFDCRFCREPLKVTSLSPATVEKAPEDYFEDPRFSVHSRFRRGGWF